ncbi:MAG: TIR domain-containing protein [Clostridiales Family XIII bacterium]|jgi:hypothetical protein|nr:TIR domain-containing protein [Clostridiales Family XIII bacterium]
MEFKPHRWETDAGNIRYYENFDSFVYRNESVKNFLEDESKYFVIATKGIGKTLLLAYKRYLLQQKYSGSDSENTSVAFIPEGSHSYVEFIESIKTSLSEDTIHALSDWEYCKKLWAMTIELTVLSHMSREKEHIALDTPPRAERHRTTLSYLVKSPRSVEFVFNELLAMRETELLHFFEGVANTVGEHFKQINSGVVLFLDRLDNALEEAHAGIWVPIQAGLLEAAWDIMRSNSHVKIYLSIRQEAYAEHRSRNANASQGAVTAIHYTDTDLRHLLNHLVSYYEKKDTVEDFLGFDTFPNTIIHQPENVFRFMFRYSIGRPRDFVEFCGKLHENLQGDPKESKEERQMRLKVLVRLVSSQEIIKNLYAELSMLLHSFKDIEMFDEFLAHIKYNILTYEEMKAVCRNSKGDACPDDCAHCPAERHPFCDLYNMGLIGVLVRDEKGERQQFKTPYEDMAQSLPKSTRYYFVHPALREYISALHTKTNAGQKYGMFNGILVGDGVRWTERFEELYHVDKCINGLATQRARAFFTDMVTAYCKTGSRSLPQAEYEAIRGACKPFELRRLDALEGYFGRNRPFVPPRISVFISYATDSEKHQEKVMAFCNMLRAKGFDSYMDLTMKKDFPQLTALMTEGLRKDKVIIVCSAEYARKADNHEPSGVWSEAKMIADDLDVNTQKYIPICFEPFCKAHVPKMLAGYWVEDLSKDRADGFHKLLARIKDEPEYDWREPAENEAESPPKKIGEF